MIDVKDIFGVSAGLKRLVEVISLHIGTVTKPFLIKKEADADAYRISTISAATSTAHTEHDVSVTYQKHGIAISSPNKHQVFSPAETTIEQRVQTRLAYQNARHQINTESVTAIAAEALEQIQTVPDEHPTHEWIARFFSIVQDISNEQLQQLWGLILEGEVCRPGRFSLKTLDFMRNLTQEDANTIKKFRPFLAQVENNYMIFLPERIFDDDKFNIQPIDYHTLVEIGIFNPGGILSFFVEIEPPSSEERIFFGSTTMNVSNKNTRNLRSELECWKITKTGREIFGLFVSQPNHNYVEHVKEHLIRDGFAVQVSTVDAEKVVLPPR